MTGRLRRHGRRNTTDMETIIPRGHAGNKFITLPARNSPVSAQRQNSSLASGSATLPLSKRCLLLVLGGLQFREQVVRPVY